MPKKIPSSVVQKKQQIYMISMDFETTGISDCLYSD